jgi:PKD repeat protein
MIPAVVGCCAQAGGGAAPVAAFVGIPEIGPSALLVGFTDASTNTPTSWTWVVVNDPFGSHAFTGGTSSASQNPQITFTYTGSSPPDPPLTVFNVTLTAGNAFGSDDEEKIGYITALA